MKTSILYTASLFLTTAVAFPANLLNGDISSETLAEINSIVARIEREAAASEKRQLGFGLVKPGFDADAQRVSNTGTHRYVSSPLSPPPLFSFSFLSLSCERGCKWKERER